MALSADGSTALIGGPEHARTLGAAWVFTRSGFAWTQQGKMLSVGVDRYADDRFGDSVALSRDGDLALIG